MAKLVRLSTIVSRIPSIWSLGLICRFTLFTVESSCSSFGGQILCLNGNYDPVRSGQRIDCEHPQGRLAVDEDMGVLSFSVSRYCRKIVSRLMAFTRDTSITG